MIRDSSGSILFEALPTSKLKARQKELLEDYALAYKAYKEAKKDNPSEPKPKKPGIRVLQKKVGGKDAKSKAEAAAAKLQGKYDERLRKKEEKEAKTT
jgi:hypothetical protein